MTNGQWVYIFGMEAVRIEQESSKKPRGKTYQIVKE